MTSGDHGGKPYWEEGDEHLEKRAKERAGFYSSKEEALQAIARDSLKAAICDASRKTSMHISTKTVDEGAWREKGSARHFEGEITKYSKTMQYCTVKGADGQMRTIFRVGKAAGEKRVKSQIKLGVDAEEKETRGLK